MHTIDQIRELPLDTVHDSADIWRGISGNHISLAQILSEFADNTLSNLRADPPASSLYRSLSIDIRDCGDTLQVIVTDSGSGIQDLQNAMTLAGRDSVESPLNEHGFGLKHALASADPDNQSWWIHTRTKLEAAQNQYIQIKAPYRVGERAMTAVICSGNGDLPQETGTQIGFTCSKHLLELTGSCKRGTKSFDGQIRALAENLGHTYSHAIFKEEIDIQICATRQDGSTLQLHAPFVCPTWAIHFDHPACICDFGRGPVTIHCQYGLMHKRSGAEYLDHYKVNMRCSGVEVRINGRVIVSGLLSEIWAAAQHNSRNRFLAIIDLICEDNDALPSTKSAKNGFREGDPKLAALYQWIRSAVPLPNRSKPREAALMDHLANMKQTDQRNLRVSREEAVFKELPLAAAVDLFIGQDDGVSIYEGKVYRSRAQDVYQLRMYADGCAHDGCPVKEAVLVAETHPDGVCSLVDHINRNLDLDYPIRLTTWEQEGVPYREILDHCRY